jgi:hypothetical protein
MAGDDPNAAGGQAREAWSGLVGALRSCWSWVLRRTDYGCCTVHMPFVYVASDNVATGGVQAYCGGAYSTEGGVDGVTQGEGASLVR